MLIAAHATHISLHRAVPCYVSILLTLSIADGFMSVFANCDALIVNTYTFLEDEIHHVWIHNMGQGERLVLVCRSVQGGFNPLDGCD